MNFWDRLSLFWPEIVFPAVFAAVGGICSVWASMYLLGYDAEVVAMAFAILWIAGWFPNPLDSLFPKKTPPAKSRYSLSGEDMPMEEG